MNRQINPNITRADLDAMARLFRALQHSLPSEASSNLGIVSSSQPPEAVKLARRVKSARNYRSTFLHSDLFGEPGWDLMLALYIAEGEGYRLRISEICDESGVPATTALRWIDKLVSMGLARKRANPTDMRSSFIEITEQGCEGMSACLLAMHHKFLEPR